MNGFNDWKNAHRITTHERSDSHLVAVKKGFENAKAHHVDSAIAKQLENEPQYWIEFPTRIVPVVTFLAKRGHPFRGHTELFGQKYNGNYLGLLELPSQFVPFLAEHIRRYGNKGRGQVLYLSSTICEEFVKLLSDRVKAKIIAEIKKAKYYSISIDSTPDIAHIDQLSIVMRYVRTDGQPVEHFLGFIDIDKHEGKYLFEILKSFLDECGIKLEDCRGQMYDNARNMSGTYSGVQAPFHQVNPLAEWISCTAHSLHLVGTAAAESSTDAVRFFGIGQRLYTFLSASPQRWSKLLENLPKQSPVVKSLSQTRWSARADTAKALASNYKVLQNSVDAIARNSTQPPLVMLEAKSLVSKRSSLNIVLMCIVWNNILDRVNKALQAPGIEIGSVVMHDRVLLEHIHSLRDSERFDRFENEAKSVAPGLDYDDENK